MSSSEDKIKQTTGYNYRNNCEKMHEDIYNKHTYELDPVRKQTAENNRVKEHERKT